jgi:sugar O-acyltransferase (sialic acid O-acetyltransferase NeuD family)
MKNDPFEVFAERNSPSDEELICTEVLVENDAHVKKGQIIFEIEGAKAIFEVTSEVDGFFYSIIREGDRFKVGQKIGYISKSKLEFFSETILDFESELRQIPNEEYHGLNFSEPAIEYLRTSMYRTQIVENLLGTAGLVTTAMIKDLETTLGRANRTLRPIETKFWSTYLNERSSKDICILIGGGFGAIQTLDVLHANDSIVPIGYVSDTKDDLVDQLGLPLLGDTSLENLKALAEENKGVKFFLTVGFSPSLRCKILQDFKKLNIELESLIHPTAIIGANVEIGAGTLIFAHVHVGTGSVIGEACFISSNSSIEHHNRIGEGFCTGPNLNTSGGVTIGREVKFGMNIGIEPGISVGDNCIVASGSVLTSDLANGSVLKSRG